MTPTNPDLSDWYRRIAFMERTDLVKAFEAETKLRGRLQAKVTKLEADIDSLRSRISTMARQQKVVLIAGTIDQADYARRRMGLAPNHTTYISTNDSWHAEKLRGLRLSPEDFRFVRGWSEGRFADQIEQQLAVVLFRKDRQIGIQSISYAPDAYDER